jgi:hypothetical protein
MSTPYFWTKLILQGLREDCIVRLNCPKGHDDVLALRRLPCGCATVEVVQIPVRALMHAWSRPGGRRLTGQWIALFDLTRLYPINRVIACSLIYNNKNLAYGEGIRLYCCDVIASTGDYDISIIMLDILYFVLCSLLPMPCPCSTGDVRAVEPHVS